MLVTSIFSFSHNVYSLFKNYNCHHLRNVSVVLCKFLNIDGSKFFNWCNQSSSYIMNVVCKMLRTLYYTILTFNNLNKKAFNHHFFLFPQCFLSHKGWISPFKQESTCQQIFVKFVEDNATMSSYTVFWKLCKEFCARAKKPKKVDHINLNFCMTDKCFDSTQSILLKTSSGSNDISTSFLRGAVNFSQDNNKYLPFSWNMMEIHLKKHKN